MHHSGHTSLKKGSPATMTITNDATTTLPPLVTCSSVDMKNTSTNNTAEQRDNVTLATTTALDLRRLFVDLQDPKTLREFLKSFQYQSVLQTMQAAAMNEDVQVAGCLVLLHLFRIRSAKRDSTSVRFTHESIQHLHRQLIELDLGQIMTRILHTYPHNPRLITYSTAFLLYWVDDDTLSDSVALELVALLVTHKENDVVVSTLLTSLYNRVRNDMWLLSRLVQAKVLPVLGQLLRRRHGRATCKVLQLLFVFVDKFPECRVQVVEMIPEVTNILRQRHHDDVDCGLPACGILWHLANHSMEAQERIVACRGVDRLVRVLLLHTKNHSHQLVLMATGALAGLSVTESAIVMHALGRSMAQEVMLAVLYHYDAQHDAVTDPALLVLSQLHEYWQRL